MKNSFKLFVLIAAIGSFTTSLKAQDYKNGIGVRISTYGAFGATFKHFTNETTALEANVTYRSYGYTYYRYNYIDVTGLYEKYQPLGDTEGLKLFYGGGVSIGSFSYSYDLGYSGSKDASFRLGVAGIVGLDYKIKDTPIAISADYMPIFNFVGGSYFSGNRGGVAVRYTF